MRSLVTRLVAVSGLVVVMIGGTSCAYHHIRGAPVELSADERHILDSLAFTIVADLRKGDKVHARKLVVSDRTLDDFLSDDSVLIASTSVMRSSRSEAGDRYGNQANRNYIFELAPAASRCPHQTEDTYRTFVFVRRHERWLMEHVIPPFC